MRRNVRGPVEPIDGLPDDVDERSQDARLPNSIKQGLVLQG